MKIKFKVGDTIISTPQGSWGTTRKGVVKEIENGVATCTDWLGVKFSVDVNHAWKTKNRM